MKMKRVQATLFVAVLLAVPLAGEARAQFDSLRKFTRPAEPVPKIAHFEIKGALTETPARIPPMFGGDIPLSLGDLVSRLKAARQDDEVVAVVIDLQNAAFGMAQLEEVHKAIRQFEAVDKDVYIHADMLTTLTYAAATSAAHVSVVPTGDVWLLGLYGEAPYLKGMLDKIGVVADYEHCGDFKTAAETLTRTDPSEPARQMSKWLYDGLYSSLVGLIADSRGVSEEKVRELMDNGPYSAEDALSAGLIDSVKHRQDFVADIKARYGKSVEFVRDYGEDDAMDMPEDNFFALVEFMMKMINPTPQEYTEPTIGVVFVEGAIMTGEAEASPFGPSAGAFSTTIRRALDKAASEPAVKAVVLRVDSPGGSALASEIILDAANRVGAEKPVIVSMGNVAASGGYYVSCNADTIFADSATITASIGVVGGKLVTTGMWDKLGINWHSNQRGRMAGIMSSAGSFNDQERAKIRQYMEHVYGIFKEHVVKGRGEKLSKPIDEMAGGRVFTGAQALELGLVDKIGGLDDAIKFAAQRAGLADYDVRTIPEPPTFFEMLTGESGDDEFLSTSTGLGLVELPLFKATLPTLAKVDPLRVRAIVRALRGIELIHREGVATLMPVEFVIR